MIYGITIVLNDCNFSLKNRDEQVKERYCFNAFFTNKKAALETYQWQLKRVKNEMSITYGKYELRGRCEFYKAYVDRGMVMEHGDIILKENIKG